MFAIKIASRACKIIKRSKVRKVSHTFLPEGIQIDPGLLPYLVSQPVPLAEYCMLFGKCGIKLCDSTVHCYCEQLYPSLCPQLPVLMVPSAWLVPLPLTMVVWRSVRTTCGVLSVTSSGLWTMLVLCASNWDTLSTVRVYMYGCLMCCS